MQKQQETIVDVFERCAYTFLHDIGHVDVALCPNEGPVRLLSEPESWLAVRIEGEVPGPYKSISVFSERRLALLVVNNMLGTKHETLPPDFTDAVIEIGNIIYGMSRTALDRAISMPFAVVKYVLVSEGLEIDREAPAFHDGHPPPTEEDKMVLRILSTPKGSLAIRFVF